MRILVTGGAGYIGSVLVAKLCIWDTSYKVTVLDNFMYRQTPFNNLCRVSNFEVVNGDARDERVLVPLLKEHDVLIPLAALVGAPLCDRDQSAARSTNYGAIVSAIKHMSADQRIIVPISNSGYGVGAPGIECTEESPLAPVSLYGRTKVEAEDAVMQRGNSISLRLATVFGMSPRMRLDLLVNDFVFRAINDRALVLFEPHFKRNYIHIYDVTSAFYWGLEEFDVMKNQIYNVGLSDANLSKLELCGEIKKQLPQFTYMEAPIGEDPDKRDYVVSNAKIEALGFKPRVSLADGIKELIKGYRMIRNTVHGNV